MKYRADIDGLRAIAVMSVVFYHMGLGHIFSGGYVGVDIFFVISGYLITGILFSSINSKSYSVSEFYKRRILRIFPALFFMLFVVALVTVITNFPNSAEAVGETIISSVLFVSNIMFFNMNGYFDHAVKANPLLHTWSLSVEEQFYIIFPLIIIAIRSFSKRRQFFTLLLILLASFFVSNFLIY